MITPEQVGERYTDGPGMTAGHGTTRTTQTSHASHPGV